MTKPTAKAIAAEVAKLKAMKPKVRRYSAFGDDNHVAIEAQIEVLEKNLTDTMIDSRSVFEDEDDYEESDKWKTNTRDAACEARKWLDGKSEDGKPSQGWENLV